MGNEEIIYGLGNGDTYTEQKYDDDGKPLGDRVERTFWANAMKVSAFAPEQARGVTVSMVPYDPDGNVLDEAIVATELSYDGCNRAIRAIRTHRDRVFGKPE